MTTTRVKTPDIIDKGKYYRLTERGPNIDKDAGTGKVLTLLLSQPGHSFSLETIANTSGWSKPRRSMRDLMREINAWSIYYQVSEVDGENPGYTINRSSGQE